jgi:hypothetical protein
VLVLEPIFEADLPDEQYGYRPGRSAQQAVIDVEETLYRGFPDVVDADLSAWQRFGLAEKLCTRIVSR